MPVPPALRRLYDGWMAFSHALGFVMSKIILTLLWIVGFGLYAIALKVIRLWRPDPNDAPGWIDVPESGPVHRSLGEGGPAEFRHQF